ncbi:MAG: ABC transporter permease [Bacteroidales bacterium]|nr:ABC transporter permease [Bacteroidales bacterium]
MKTNIKMAWRNLWRNKRRTLITTASVFFAVIFALIMRSMQLGTYSHLYKSIIESYTGYVQVQHEDFWDDRMLDNGFFLTSEMEQQILSIDNVEGIIPHLESGALASNEIQTKGVLILGIDPIKENKISKLDDKLVFLRLTKSAIKDLIHEDIAVEYKKIFEGLEGESYANLASLQLDLNVGDDAFESLLPLIEKYAAYPGTYLNPGDNGVLLGDKLSKYLKLNVGDTLVLLGQGYHGVSANGKFPVKGLIRIPNPLIENMAVFMDISTCQYFSSGDQLTTSAILDLKDNSDKAVSRTKAELLEMYKGTEYTAKDWREMNETLIKQLEADNQGGLIMLVILYLIIAFGVFGTVLMMTAERKREFGVLISIGMQRSKLAFIMAIEMIFIGLLGILSGIAGSIPIVIYGYYNPIQLTGESAKMYEEYGFDPVMKFLWFDDYYFWQSMIVMLIVMIAIIYPVRKILRIKEIEALRA